MAAKWVNGFAALANEETVRALVQSEIAYWVIKMNVLRNRIDKMRVKAKRGLNDLSISELPELQSQLENMQSEYTKSKRIRSDFQHISTMQVMQIAAVPSRPINKPVFKWVTLTGALSGLVLGVLSAFIADFARPSSVERK